MVRSLAGPHEKAQEQKHQQRCQKQVTKRHFVKKQYGEIQRGSMLIILAEQVCGARKRVQRVADTQKVNDRRRQDVLNRTVYREKLSQLMHSRYGRNGMLEPVMWG